MISSPPTASASYEIVREGAGTLRVSLSGRWSLAERVPSLEPLAQALGRAEGARRVLFEPSGIEAWDSALVTFVHAAAGLA